MNSAAVCLHLIISPTVRQVTGLPDHEIYNRPDRLVQVFEGYWAELARSLQKCRRPDDLILIFSVLKGQVWDDHTALFYTPSNHPGTSVALSKIRHELRALVKPMRIASEANHQAYQRMQGARSALAQRATRHERKLVRKEFVKRWKEGQQIECECKKLNDREKTLRADSKLSEASFTLPRNPITAKSRIGQRHGVYTCEGTHCHLLSFPPFPLSISALGFARKSGRASLRTCARASALRSVESRSAVVRARRASFDSPRAR